MKDRMLIQGGRLIDPARGIDELGDLFVVDGHIDQVPEPLPSGTRVLDARGHLVTPGFWDVHVHFREPGGEAQETIRTGSAAAVRGGFTCVVMMPNTQPALDTPEWVRRVLEEGARHRLCRVLTTGCLTHGRAGTEVADLAALREAGAVAFTDDGCTVQDDAVMEAAMRQAAALNCPVMDHAQDRNMEKQGVMHEGAVSRRLGLPGIPSEAEARIVARDLLLAERTGCHLHVQHVTSAAATELIREARMRGVPVTAEVSPHHLALCDEDVDVNRPDAYKMNPPLRTAQDREALRRGCVEGVLDVFATDHAPHTAEAKALGFLEAPFGVLGLETAVGVTYTQLVRTGRMSVMEWISRWTCTPAGVLGLAAPSLAAGAVADVVVLDTATEWRVEAARFASRSQNTSFEGWPLYGRARWTVFEGRIVWDAAADRC